MKQIVFKYGVLIGVGLLINNYIRIFPSVQYIIDQTTSGWVAIIYLIGVLMFGINDYVKYASSTNSYRFSTGLLVGVLMTLMGTILFSIVSSAILIQYNKELDIIQTVLSRILKLGFIGALASVIILLTYNMEED